jgi:hypothetical protein
MMFVNGSEAGDIRLVLSADASSSRDIRVKVEVQNPTDHLLQVSTTDRNPPVELSIWDDFGNDLYQYAYSDRSKDGKSADPSRRRKNVAVDLQGKQKKDYSWTVSKVFVNGKLVSIPPGHYKLRARLAAITNSDGRTQTKLYQSNEVDVVVR